MALPETTRLMAVVKADGYGHGGPWIARAALNAGAALLGVATVDEGQVLRAHGVEAPIVLLGSIDAAEAPAACETGLEITVAGERLLEPVQRALQPGFASSPISVHLKSIPDCVAMAQPCQKRSPWQPGSQTTHISALLHLHPFRLSGRTRRAVHGCAASRNSSTRSTRCAAPECGCRHHRK